MKAIKMLVIYLLAIFPVAALCLVLIISGSVSVFYSGFAVDADGVLYVGKTGVIEKYYDSNKVCTINTNTTRGYAFTIKDDKIVLSTASTVYFMDLEGHVIREQEDEGTHIFNELQSNKKSYTTQSGDIYRMTSPLLRYTITDASGDVIYQMPTADYLCKLAFFACILSAFVFVPIIIRKWKNEIAP